MPWYFTAYILPLLIAIVLAQALAFLAWQRSTTGARILAGLMVVTGLWSLGYALEITAAAISAKLFWAKFQYFCIVTIPVLWLVLALHFTRRVKWLAPRYLLLLSLVPLITLVLVWTNEAHGLIWQQVGLDTTRPLTFLKVNYGWWFFVHWVFSYALLLLGTLLLVRMLFRSRHLYRSQTGILLMGVLIPWIGNGVYLFKLGPVPNLDLTPITLTLAGLLMGWGFYRYRLLEITPVARGAVVEMMTDGVVVLDDQQRVIELNPAAQRILSCNAFEVIGLTHAEIFARWPHLVEQCRTEQKASLEFALAEEPELRYFEAHLSPLHDQRTRFQGCLIVLHDITERKQAEEALRRSEEQFRLVFELGPVGMAVTTLTGKIIRVNQAFCDMLRYSAEELLTRKFQDITHPDDLPLNLALDEQLIKGEIPRFRLEKRYIRKDGAVINIILQVVLVHDPAGQPSHFVGQVVDITERKQIERALRESEEKFRILAETTTAAIIIHQGTKLLYVNPAAEVISGYSQAELVATNFWEFVHPDFQDLVKQRAVARLEGKAVPPAYEVKVLCKNGQEKWIYLTTGVLEFDGQPTILATLFDITRLKETEEALSQARDQALEASRLKTQLLANVSHDLRTPLNAVLGYTEMLQEGIYGPLSASQQIATKEIIESTGQLLNFVNNLLGRAQIEAGKVSMRVSSFAPTALIENLRALTNPLIQNKMTKVTYQIDDDVPEILYGDLYWLQQILVNLVGNAIKFTEQGTVAVFFYRPNANYWAIDVADTGPGIPAEAQPHVFEAFWQVDGTTTRQHGGAGLGLSIVKELTTLMGGQISLESAPGVGTVFTVLLPLSPIQEKMHDPNR